MLFRKLVVVGLVGIISLTANIAIAEDASAPGGTFIGADNVSFTDAARPFESGVFEIAFHQDIPTRFVDTREIRPNAHRDDHRYEVALTARAAAGLDVSFAQRGGLGFNDQGDIDRASHGSELRLGRGLRGFRRDAPSSTPAFYLFAASDDEALVWRPNTRNAFGGAGSNFALQDRVEIGDVQAGVTYELNGLQASLAYVQRKVSVRTGSRSISRDEDFTGLTITHRH